MNVVLLLLVLVVIGLALFRRETWQVFLVLGAMFLLIMCGAIIALTANRSMARSDERSEDANEHLTNADVANTVAVITGVLGVVAIGGGLLLRSNASKAAPLDVRVATPAFGGKRAFCGHCGAPATPGGAFCRSCGNAL